MTLNRKAAFVIWYLVLWGTCTWALFELFYDRSGYPGGQPTLMFAFGISGLLLATTGYPLYSHLRKKEIHKKGAFLLSAVFLTATVLLVSCLAQCASVTAVNKARIQWYLDDLKSQGFDVQYWPHYAYSRGMAPIWVNSYSNFTRSAKDINCSTVYVYGGGPLYFLFFIPSNIDFIAMKYPWYALSLR